MSTIAVAPLVLKDYTVKVAADNYEKAVSAVSFTPPSPQVETWVGPEGSEHTDETVSGPWKCQIDYVQDWETAGSFSIYLLENDGETVTMEFVPTAGTGKPKFTSSVIVRSGPIGGTTRKHATGSVTLTATKPVPGTVA